MLIVRPKRRNAFKKSHRYASSTHIAAVSTRKSATKIVSWTNGSCGAGSAEGYDQGEFGAKFITKNLECTTRSMATESRLITVHLLTATTHVFAVCISIDAWCSGEHFHHLLLLRCNVHKTGTLSAYVSATANSLGLPHSPTQALTISKLSAQQQSYDGSLHICRVKEREPLKA